MRRSIALLMALIAPIALFLAGCPDPDDGGDDGKIKIGVVLPTTGPNATYGQEAVNGIKLALEQYDLSSLPAEVEFIYKDNKSESNESEKSVVELIQVERVNAIIGSVASTNSLAGGKHAQENKVPMLSPASTATTVTEIGEYVSRICFIDPFQGSAAAQFAKETLGASKAYLVVDKDSDYSVGLAAEFEKKFKALGGQIVGTVYFQQKQDDFAGVIDRVAQAKPDVAFIPGYYAEVGPMLRQAVGKWDEMAKVGGDGWDSEKLFEHADALRKCYITNHFSANDQSEQVKQFVDAYKKKYGSAPGAMAALGYDACLVMLDAIKRAGSGDPAKIKDAINATKGLEGVTGAITLDDKRNATKDLVVLAVTPNGYEFKARVSPGSQ